ncbi:hypothetical protein M885DRAFT_622946, partial [Pelagophyceae sp. CCMP2097]
MDDSSVLEAANTQERTWHSAHGIPFVEVGATFEVGCYPFKRVDTRAASCLTCSKAFNAYSYHTRALEAHGLSCARRDLQRTDAASARAARRDEWSGTIEYQGEISGILVRCTFNKKILTGGVKGMVCDICSTELMVVAKYYQKQHVEAKHKPKG